MGVMNILMNKVDSILALTDLSLAGETGNKQASKQTKIWGAILTLELEGY